MNPCLRSLKIYKKENKHGKKKVLLNSGSFKYLGVSPNTVRKWIRSGRIPFVKINGAIRFDEAKIEARLNQRQVSVV